MDIYAINLTLLLALCGAIFLGTTNLKSLSPSSSLSPTSLKSNPLLPFYLVYTLVMASDWLQGPFLYSLYRDEHAVPPSLIPTLFTTGFLSGAASGSVIGSWADRNGRKNACLLFCAVYATSCILTTIPGGSIPLLFLGRVLGGIGTSLLFSVFESWMVTDVKNSKSKSEADSDLAKIFGVMSTLNSLVAIASGVISEWLVTYTGTKKSPFWLGVVLLLLAAGIISTTWKENYAPSSPGSSSNPSSSSSSITTLLSSPTLLSLTLTTTLFEGSMYLFVFFWSPALLSFQSTTPLPFGLIFSSFMASTLSSSLLFTPLSNSASAKLKLTGSPHSALLAILLASSSVLLLLSASPKTEQSAFWVFCLFEAAVGLYFPTMGFLKGKLIDDSVRAQVYGLLRIPLNVFVVGALVLTRDAGENGFGKVFTVCSGLLMVAAGVVGVTLGRGGGGDDKKKEVIKKE
ncbi:major facilitator superfamily transporter [Cladorrhinum sp. PSN332]|nr:major facilitator superfamily transporter [Cladorrhinum sp. PSN332]